MPLTLFRVIIPVPDIERAVAFYSQLLDTPGQRIAPGRHYFHCGPTILAIVDPSGHQRQWLPNPELVYFDVSDLEEAFRRAQRAGGTELHQDDTGWGIQTHPWGERSFYIQDPFGNPLCFVDDQTLFTGTAPTRQEP